MASVYIGIGSNLGDRQKNIETALSILRASQGVTVKKVSSIYETAPVGGPLQGPYLNGVAEVETLCPPRDLLKLLNSIEAALGRVRKEPNGPRTIDLDILIYGDVEMADKDLVIPHPRMRQREFVLKGLCEIAPHLEMCKNRKI